MTERLTIGILAHVDAGKTTLSEHILYKTGSIRKIGRVDHKDTFLDNFELERARGITIFSKQARFTLGEKEFTLLDTPGHVDFSAEMERTLQVLDYAILVINGASGVQGHTETLWRLLKRYEIPTFLFVNKMDQPGTEKEKLLEELQKKLDDRVLDFTPALHESICGRTASEKLDCTEEEVENWKENIAMLREDLMEAYLESGDINIEETRSLVTEREVFPCLFGSALKGNGVSHLLEAMELFAVSPERSGEFGAKVFKISRDPQNNRLTHLKVTGGALKVKQLITMHVPGKEEDEISEKIDQIRIYSGSSFEAVNEAPAGTVCAVTGLSGTYCGQGIGSETQGELPLLEPVLNYQIILPPGVNVHQMYLKLRGLEEEEPQLHLVWQEKLGEIHAQMMGEVQTQILQSMIKERFGVVVEFGPGNIVYKETISNTVEGIGHFEPLRHYAEVHLLMEPGERGSGLQFHTDLSEDILDRNWQRLILTHLEEKQHRGVLTGSEITDISFTLINGRSHLKHTEGGDFRQATYRAVRQGLMQAESHLLEPVYEFRLELPPENLGRALNDLQKMHGTFSQPDQEGEFSVICGSAPVSCMQGYQSDVISYTKGRGKLTCRLKGYELCHNEEEVMASSGYDPEFDFDDPTGSVFCSHGAGYVVPWYAVPNFCHLEMRLRPVLRNLPADAEIFDRIADDFEEEEYQTGANYVPETKAVKAAKKSNDSYENYLAGNATEKELEEIFTRTYGKAPEKKSGFGKTVYASSSGENVGSVRKKAEPDPGAPVHKKQQQAIQKREQKAQEKEYLLVDGYNIIFSWDELRELSEKNVAAARMKLMDILSNYQGFRKCELILVFDAYKVEGGTGEIYKYHNIHVVFTKEAETADQYIEKTAHEIGRKYRTTVATSDGVEQVIIMGQGCARMSATDLHDSIENAKIEIREICQNQTSGKNYLFDQLPEEMAQLMEDVRLGRKKMPEEG